MPLTILILLVIASTFLVLHMIYQLYFLIGLIRIKPAKDSDVKQPGVSIIIAARDEVMNLEKLIPTLQNQDYPEFEIVVINDRSNDSTYDYLLQFKNHPVITPVNVDYLPDHVNSKKYALTLGIKAAKFDTLLFTDADCEPSSTHWIRDMASKYGENKRMVIGFSPYLKFKGLLNSLIRFETHLSGIQYLGSASNKRAYMGVGRNLSYQKSYFLSKKGFNGFLDVTGGDDDLFVNKNSNRSNTTVALTPESVTYSIPKKTWKEYNHQKIRHLSTGRLYKKRDKIFLGIFSFSHLASWVILVTALILNQFPLFIGSIFAVSYILFIFNFQILNKKSGSKYSLWSIPFVNIVFTFFYIFVGLQTIFTKKVAWTT